MTGKPRARLKVHPALMTEAERRAYRTVKSFKAAADPEVRAFLEATLPIAPSIQAAARLAKAKFGGRAPSKSAIHRWWLALPTAHRDRIRDAALKLEGPLPAF